MPIVSVQNRYNVVDRASEDVLQECAQQQRLAFLLGADRSRNDIARHGRAVPRRAPDVAAPRPTVAVASLLAHSPVILPIATARSRTSRRTSTPPARTEEAAEALDELV